jgi:PKD repeat protein
MPRAASFQSRLPAHGLRALRSRRRTRGQSLVEFALVLPLLLFLTLIALDFGRVYLGYINIQNMARIAANYAANNPDAWTGSGDADAQTTYRNQILQDGAVSNCALPKSGGTTVVPPPVFTDVNKDGVANTLGDTAQVQVSCTFGVITPMIANILGGSVTVSAQSTFPVKTGMTASGDDTGGGPVGSAPNAAFIGNGVVAPAVISGSSPFAVEFRDTSGGSPTGWSWTFQGGSIPTSSAQDPGNVTFTTAGVHTVTLEASNFLGSSTVTMNVTVIAATAVDFTSAPNPASGAPGLNVTFADASATGGTSYVWTFGAGEGGVTNPTNAPVSHIYNTAGTYTVGLTVTYPTGAVTTTKIGFVNVAISQCVAPSLNKVKRNSAPGVWSGAGFTGLVADGPGAPKGNYEITTQTVVAGSTTACTSGVLVNHP